MEPSVVTRQAFTALGIQLRINPRAADYRAIWEEQFMEYHEAIKALAQEEGYYGIYFRTDEPGVVDCAAGMAVGRLSQAPDGLVTREVPGAQYAVAQCGMHSIGATWGFLYERWIEQSPYQEDPTSACFDYFPSDVHSSNSLVSIHVPIKPK